MKISTDFGKKMFTLSSILNQAYHNGDYEAIFSIFKKSDEMIDRYNQEGEDLAPLFLSFIKDFGKTGNTVLLDLLVQIPQEFTEDFIYDQDVAFLEGLKEAPIESLKERMQTLFDRYVNEKYPMKEWDGHAFLKFLPSDLKPFFKSAVDYKGNH